jgi:hypothetical protein
MIELSSSDTQNIENSLENVVDIEKIKALLNL